MWSISNKARLSERVIWLVQLILLIKRSSNVQISTSVIYLVPMESVMYRGICYSIYLPNPKVAKPLYFSSKCSMSRWVRIKSENSDVVRYINRRKLPKAVLRYTEPDFCARVYMTRDRSMNPFIPVWNQLRHACLPLGMYCTYVHITQPASSASRRPGTVPLMFPDN